MELIQIIEHTEKHRKIALTHASKNINYIKMIFAPALLDDPHLLLLEYLYDFTFLMPLNDLTNVNVFINIGYLAESFSLYAFLYEDRNCFRVYENFLKIPLLLNGVLDFARKHTRKHYKDKLWLTPMIDDLPKKLLLQGAENFTKDIYKYYENNVNL